MLSIRLSDDEWIDFLSFVPDNLRNFSKKRLAFKTLLETMIQHFNQQACIKKPSQLKLEQQKGETLEEFHYF